MERNITGISKLGLAAALCMTMTVLAGCSSKETAAATDTPTASATAAPTASETATPTASATAAPSAATLEQAKAAAHAAVKEAYPAVDEDNVSMLGTIQDAEKVIDFKGTGLIILSSQADQVCQDAMQMIDEAAAYGKQSVMIVDIVADQTENTTAWSGLLERLNKYAPDAVSAEGVVELPTVLFVREGKVIDVEFLSAEEFTDAVAKTFAEALTVGVGKLK